MSLRNFRIYQSAGSQLCLRLLLNSFNQNVSKHTPSGLGVRVFSDNNNDPPEHHTTPHSSKHYQKIYRSYEVRCLYDLFIYHFFIFFWLHFFYHFIYGCMFCMLLFNCTNLCILLLFLCILIVMHVTFSVLLHCVVLCSYCMCVKVYCTTYHRVSTQLQ
jgi:hypothetical protein